MLVYCFWSFKDLLATWQDIHKTSNKTRVFPDPTLATCCGFKGSKTNSFSSCCQKDWNKHLQKIIIVSMENYHRNLLCFQHSREISSYCWWKKSCTSWYVVYPIIYKVIYPRWCRISSINSSIHGWYIFLFTHINIYIYLYIYHIYISIFIWPRTQHSQIQDNFEKINTAFCVFFWSDPFKSCKGGQKNVKPEYGAYCPNGTACLIFAITKEYSTPPQKCSPQRNMNQKKWDWNVIFHSRTFPGEPFLKCWGYIFFQQKWGPLMTGWWFQPIWKNISQIGSFPQVGVKPSPRWIPTVEFFLKLEEK